MPPPPAGPPVPRARREPRRARCRRFRRHPPPGPGLTPDTTRGPRGPRGVRALRGFPDRRRPQLPRPTSGARVPARLVLRPRGPAGRAGQGASAQAGPRDGRTSRARGVRVPGRLRRGLRDLVVPGRVRPGRAGLVPVAGVHVPARGRVTTRSARPRPAWDRRLRPGPKHPARPVSRLSPAVPDRLRAPRPVPEVLVVLVRPDVARAGQARRTEDLAQAGSRVRVLAVPGQAR
jgi:hypothetical protein